MALSVVQFSASSSSWWSEPRYDTTAVESSHEKNSGDVTRSSSCVVLCYNKQDSYTDRITEEAGELRKVEVPQELSTNETGAGSDNSGTDTATITAASDEWPCDNVDNAVNGSTSDSLTTAESDTPCTAGETEQQHSTAVASEPDAATALAAAAAGVHNTDGAELAYPLEDQLVVGFASDADSRADGEGTVPPAEGSETQTVDIYSLENVGYEGGFSSGDATASASAADVQSINDVIVNESSVGQLNASTGIGAELESPSSLIVGEEGSITLAGADQIAPAQSFDVAVAVGSGDSAAVTPMDEYRHLLRQQDGAFASDGVPTASNDEFVNQQGSVSVANGGHIESNHQLDVISLSSSSAAETLSPMACGSAARPPSYAEGFAEELLQQQQLQESTLESAFLRQQEQVNSTDTWSTTTSTTTTEITAQSISPAVDPASSLLSVSPTGNASAAVSPSTHSIGKSAEEPKAKQQRPPLLPLTIKTDEVHQSWATDAGTRVSINELCLAAPFCIPRASCSRASASRPAATVCVRACVRARVCLCAEPSLDRCFFFPYDFRRRIVTLRRATKALIGK
jgi:hypothetical protein